LSVIFRNAFERGISADQVIAILPVEAQIMANPVPPQFRVLYRTV
jgi:hypothetical protein